MKSKDISGDSIYIGVGVALSLFGLLMVGICAYFGIFLGKCSNCDRPMQDSQEYCIYCGESGYCK